MNRGDPFKRDHQMTGRAPAVSSLTADPVLQRIFRGIEDDGAIEIIDAPPRPPVSPACAAELAEV